MSGSDDALPVLDERTRQLITSLIEASTQSLRSELQASFAARPAPSLGDGAGASRQNPSAEPRAGAVPYSLEIRAGSGAASEVPARGGSGPVANAGAPDAEDFDEEGGGVDEEDEDDDEATDRDGGPQAFTPEWHEACRGRRIPPRFEIPARFDPLYPVAFKAESAEHIQTFRAGGVSAGREGEAGGLYRTAAYLTTISNSLVALGKKCEALEVLAAPLAAVQEGVREVRWAMSDAQVAVHGTLELNASRYELLCGLQGASGTADPGLLGSYLDAPAGYSRAGQQAFRLQQRQAIRSAAQVAGRRTTARRPSASPSGTSATGRDGGFRNPPGGGSGRTRNRRGGRGGGTPASSAGTR
jgi:hypothetical protein